LQKNPNTFVATFSGRKVTERQLMVKVPGTMQVEVYQSKRDQWVARTRAGKVPFVDVSALTLEQALRQIESKYETQHTQWACYSPCEFEIGVLVKRGEGYELSEHLVETREAVAQ
jgi:hypothetical protein